MLPYRHTCASADSARRAQPRVGPARARGARGDRPRVHLHLSATSSTSTTPAGIDTNDGRWSIWVVSWVAHALTTDPRRIFRANIFYPHDNALAFSEGNFVGGAIGDSGMAADEESLRHAQLLLYRLVRAVVGGHVLPGPPSHRRPARGGDRRHPVRVLPFAFARQAHSQLLMIGFLPWAMLAFHRFVDRVSVARAIELGVVLWLTGLACAYYGIFAGGMVALGSICFAITRGHWKRAALLDDGRAGRGGLRRPRRRRFSCPTCGCRTPRASRGRWMDRIPPTLARG